MYQILDESKIKDSQNNIINLNNNTIIMTSNIGFEETSLGFTNKIIDNVNINLKEKFSPSLINRIDNIIIFNHLNKKDITKIIKNKLNKLNSKYPGFTYENTLIEDIIKDSNYEEFGARRIDKIIDSKLENLIIDKLINKSSINITSLKECLSI